MGTNFKIIFCLLRTAFCLLVCCQPVNAQTDGTQYPISDPRNPNCPCHAQQKLADEEYKRELEKNKNQAQHTNIIVQNDRANIIPNQIADQPLPQGNLENNIAPELPQLASAPLQKPEINFSLNIAKPSFGGSGGGSYKYKSHYWKKTSFKAKRKLKKTFQHKKKIKINHSSCFKW